MHQPETNGSANAEARNDALIERARRNPGKFTIIQSKIANGEGLQMVMTVVTGSFWDDSDNPWAIPGAVEGQRTVEDDEDDDADDDGIEDGYSGRSLDGVDMMMARMALNGFLRSRGEPETF